MKEEPIWPTGQWREALKAKDAEIERLKALITECADALEAKTSCVEDDDIALIKRAREATR